MIKDDEPGTMEPPRPTPISSVSDLAMPKFATFGFCVRSGIWALARVPYRSVTVAAIARRNKIAAIFNPVESFIPSPLRFEFASEKSGFWRLPACGKIVAPPALALDHRLWFKVLREALEDS